MSQPAKRLFDDFIWKLCAEYFVDDNRWRRAEHLVNSSSRGIEQNYYRGGAQLQYTYCNHRKLNRFGRKKGLIEA